MQSFEECVILVAMDDPGEGRGARPTEASTLSDRLRGEIVGGLVRPGERLKLVPLSRRFSVSRGPLREAATRLEAEGLLTFEDQRGFRVSPISRADLLDLTRTRQRVEGWALHDAIEHGDLAWEGRVMAAAYMLDRVTDHDGSPAARETFARHHATFHAELVSGCPSRHLLKFRARLYALSERYRNLTAESRARGYRRRKIRKEHGALAEAATARDAERAQRLLEEHIARTAQTLLALYPDLFPSSDDGPTD